jgi:hypothetical protein
MRKMETQKIEESSQKSETKTPQETVQETLETQGITKQSMDNEAKNKEAFQRITTGALSVLSFGREFFGTRYTRPVFPPIISLRVSGVITVAFEP